MIDIKSLSEKVETLEARCVYLGIVCSAMFHALPDKENLLANLKAETKVNGANSLYATSLSDRQQNAIQAALEILENTLDPTHDSQRPSIRPVDPLT